MTDDALLIPKMAEEALRSLNRVYAGSRSLAFSSAGRGWTLTLDATAKAAVWRARVYLRLGDFDIAVFLDSLLPADWEGSGLSAHTLSALPTELAGAALELVCRDLAEGLETATGLEVSVSGLNMVEEEAWLPDEGFCFLLSRDDGQTVRGAAAASAPALAMLADLVERLPENTSDMSGVFDMPLPFRIILTGPELTASELRGLEPGDVLLAALPSPAKDSGLPVRLAASDTCWAPARLAGALLYLEGTMTQEPDESLAEGMEEAAGGADEAAPEVFAPGDLPLAVRFDLGGTELTVAEASRLAPGQTLPTGRDVAAPVRILAAGRLIGTGSLVDVAGSLGVRIERLTMKQQA
jgi:type III secretion system YscQ/HrcQ family protein